METDYDPVFARHVGEGLDAEPRYLRSRYFYDAEGDRLFQGIMGMPEYYLTDCEFEIFERQGDAIAAAMAGEGELEVVELGSGDGLKTELLIDALHRADVPFVYRPVDISDNSLDLLADRLAPDRPWLRMDPIHGDYEHVLEELHPGARRRVVLFLGSNLGNYGHAQAAWFLRLIRTALGPGDRLMIGLDLKKDPHVIRAAYNDEGGWTRAFNLNLLERINRELGGDFDVEGFDHRPEYDPDTGAARSWLVSLRSQEVRIDALDRSFRFEKGERVFMEVSQKYDDAMIRQMAAEAGFRVAERFFDERHWFTDQLWAPIDDG